MLSWLLDVAAAAVPVLLGWVVALLRRIDSHLERLETHDRVLFGEDRIDDDDGLVDRVEQLRQDLDELANRR